MKINRNTNQYKANSLERKYNLIGMIFFGVPLAFGGMLVAENLGLNIKLWWSFFAVMFIPISFGWAAFFAQRGYKKLLAQSGNNSTEVKRAYYVARRAKWLAYILAWSPLVPLVLILLGLKVSSYLGIVVIVLWSFGRNFAHSKAIKETGYNPA